MHGLAGTRVLDLSAGISGPYATKLLADAGADVIQIEPPGGHPMREAPLWAFLHHGKRSVVGSIGDAALDDLLSTANLVVDTAVPALVEPAAVREEWPSLVLLSITPFGRTGPYAGRPATDFTIQAESGGIAIRGHRSWYQAGGRIVEWVSGTFAAVAALACLRRSASTGIGESIDLSMLELANLASTTFTDLTWSLLGRPPLDGLPPARIIETPSIEPTADGYVGFCTNSRQQFDDFLLLIERPDLLGDEQLARHQGRAARFEEWTEVVRTWTTKYTTAEIIERASQLRLPVAPVCNGATVEQQVHFRERGIFRLDPTGTFRIPARAGCRPNRSRSVGPTRYRSASMPGTLHPFRSRVFAFST